MGAGKGYLTDYQRGRYDKLYGIDPYISLLIIIPAFFAIGLVTQKAVINSLTGRPMYVPLFATAGLGTAMQNAALFFWKSDYRIAATSYSDTVLNLAGLKLQFPLLMAFVGSILVTLALNVLLKKTLIGKAIRTVPLSSNRSLILPV